MRYIIKGINDDQTICDNCGKKGLKRVVWLSKLDDDNNEIDTPFAVGTTCAARLFYNKDNKKTCDKVLWQAQIIQYAINNIVQFADKIVENIFQKYGKTSEYKHNVYVDRDRIDDRLTICFEDHTIFIFIEKYNNGIKHIRQITRKI